MVSLMSSGNPGACGGHRGNHRGEIEHGDRARLRGQYNQEPVL